MHRILLLYKYNNTFAGRGVNPGRFFLSFRLFRYQINNVRNCILVEMALLLEWEDGGENWERAEFCRPDRRESALILYFCKTMSPALRINLFFALAAL